MLQGLVEGSSAQLQNLATWGTQWWQGTACAYPWVQNYIGYCPPPLICQYVPDFMLETCKTAVSTIESLDPTTALYSTLALTSAYLSWQAYRQMTVVKKEMDDVSLTQVLTTKAMIMELQEVTLQIRAIHAQLESLNQNIDSLTPKEANLQIDAIKRARAHLAAYMKQAGVSDIFYGDKIREMGLEILAKNQDGEAVFHDPMQILENEEIRLTKTLSAKEEEQRQRKAQRPAFALHVAKDTEKAARTKLLAEIEEAKGKVKSNALKST